MDANFATVFIIDDDEDVRRSLERLVRSAGWAAETFECAQAFLERPAYAGAGCVVLDVQMPGMTGPVLQEQFGLSVGGERLERLWQLAAGQHEAFLARA